MGKLGRYRNIVCPNCGRASVEVEVGNRGSEVNIMCRNRQCSVKAVLSEEKEPVGSQFLENALNMFREMHLKPGL